MMHNFMTRREPQRNSELAALVSDDIKKRRRKQDDDLLRRHPGLVAANNTWIDGENSLDRDQMFSGGRMGNLIKNCEYYTELENQTGRAIYVSDGLAQQDWGAVWRKEQDWLGGQATATTVTGGASLITRGAARSPYAFLVLGGVHFGYTYFTSFTYHPQDVRDYCNYSAPPGIMPGPYYPPLVPINP